MFAWRQSAWQHMTADCEDRIQPKNSFLSFFLSLFSIFFIGTTFALLKRLAVSRKSDWPDALTGLWSVWGGRAPPLYQIIRADCDAAGKVSVFPHRFSHSGPRTGSTSNVAQTASTIFPKGGRLHRTHTHTEWWKSLEKCDWSHLYFADPDSSPWMICRGWHSLAQPDTGQTWRRSTDLPVNKAAPQPSLTPLSNVS